MVTDSLVVNARYRNISQIAESFILNDQYLELLVPNHSIITGPRGCGKTTLLKMLTPNAIDIISERHKTIPTPDFVGIYIPADKQWLRQHLTLKKRIVDESVYRPIIKCLVNSNCLISVFNTLDYILYSRINSEEIAKRIETDICKEVKEQFAIKDSFPNTFHHLKQYFYKIIGELNTQINKFYFGYLSVKDFELNELSYKETIDLIQPIYDIFYFNTKSVKSKIPKQTWALCFDELEISPSWLINDLISTYFRSTYQNLLLKVTGTPIISSVAESSVSAPQIDHDFSRIECWVYDANSRRRWVNFCEKFINNKYGINNMHELLGKHDYTEALAFSEKDLKADSDEIPEWSEGSTMWKAMIKLAEFDQSFNAFLLSKDIDPANPKPRKGQIDSIHRKIKPIIAFRYYFKKSDSKRSRKAIHLYYGEEHLYELTDGNPRMFLKLLHKYDYYLKNRMRIPIPIQAQYINEFSNDTYDDFRDDPEGYSFNEYSLQKLIDRVGQYTYVEIVTGPFNMDPHSCFSIEKDTPENIKRLVLYGLETGALQILKDSKAKSQELIFGRRIRLSYALHPKFRIPKRIYETLSLDTMLKQNHNLTLFDNEV